MLCAGSTNEKKWKYFTAKMFSFDRFVKKSGFVYPEKIENENFF